MSDRVEVMMKAKNYGGGHNLKRLLALLFIAILLLSIAPTASANPWASYKEITIDNTKVDATLENFPVLISITDTDLRDDAQDDGDDIVFTDGTNSIRLDHEIEKFDGSNGALQAWVRIPSLSSGSDTVIRMYYGNPTCGNQENPTGVWDTNYKMVQHLEETDIDGGSGDIKDSTFKGNNGTTSGMDANDQVAGKVNGALNFDGNGIYIDAGQVISSPSNAWTYSAWFNGDVVVVNNAMIMELEDNGGGEFVGIGLVAQNPNFKIFSNGKTSGISNTHPEAGVWYYIAMPSR